MGTRHTPPGGHGEWGEVGGRVAYRYMLPAILPLGNVVALAYNPAPFILPCPRRGGVRESIGRPHPGPGRVLYHAAHRNPLRYQLIGNGRSHATTMLLIIAERAENAESRSTPPPRTANAIQAPPVPPPLGDFGDFHSMFWQKSLCSPSTRTFPKKPFQSHHSHQLRAV